ncbi:MAG: uridine kinase [Verrucomicrobiota bacterium]
MKAIRLIAVVGGSGSGKTWLAAELAGELGDEAAHLCLDNFYKDLSHLSEPERERVNFDDPAAIDWDALRVVLESLERGETARVPVYDFAEHVRKPEVVELESRPIILVDGLWLLHPEWLRKRFALSVFVDCPEEVRLQRRLERDVIARGRTRESVNKQFAGHVQPMHDRFVEPQREWAMRCVTTPLVNEEKEGLLAACRG